MSVKLIKRVINFVASSPKRLKSSRSSSETKMKVFTQTKNPLTGSSQWDVQDEDYDYYQEIARSSFADMLHDSERNRKYYRALQIAIEKMQSAGRKANVLDIGTGTGLLSIMAANCGADSIVACEAFKPMAECCQQILNSNGVAHKVKLISKRSTDITVGEDGDMKEKANILVTEVFDTELIGEGALATFNHAHKYLMEEDCIVVPDSAIIYAQVVECPTLQKWNKLNDLIDPEYEYILKTPQKMKDCPGSAAVHDIQLSQLPRNKFRELSEQIPVFYYDWSGRSPIDMKRFIKQEFQVINTGRAQMVFMWWELSMDTEGKICLSCAPWWSHPDVNRSAKIPQNTIPWRDHWMQAVYYLPQELTLEHGKDAALIACQDEYSLWFYLENEKQKYEEYERPVCDCGIHMALSRTHVSYLNDGKRNKKFVGQLLKEMNKNSIILDMNGSSFIGLLAAKMGAKTVYILETMKMNVDILKDYIETNHLTNVEFIEEINGKVLKKVTNVICDPNFGSAILPWENLRMAYLLYQHRKDLKAKSILPEGFELWAMPVEFRDLHKIRIPLGICEGVDMSIFDELVESARNISDAEMEAQPLWEYPCTCRGLPRKLLDIDFKRLQQIYATENLYNLGEAEASELFPMNGFALWPVWKVGGGQSAGPTRPPRLGEQVEWDSHTRQAIKIFKNTILVQENFIWGHQVLCDLEKGSFNVNVDLVWVGD